MKARNALLKLVPLLLCLGVELCVSSPVAAQQPVPTTVCAIMDNPGSFAGQVVRVRATVSSGFDRSTIIDANPPAACEARVGKHGPWFDSAPKKNGPPAMTDRDAELQNRSPVFLVEDENMGQFVSALGAQATPPEDRCDSSLDGYPKYEVTATMIGRVDYSESGGFGHFGAWKVRFLLTSVQDVATRELSYDYLKCQTSTPPQKVEPPRK
jgi:hypothetical protein